jgi:hypothetical protein
MRIGVKLKFWLFRNYWWLLGTILVGAVAFLLCTETSITSIATVAGSVLSVIYFIQKQRLEELKLFRELFKEFNARYDGMNENLASIISKNNTPLTSEEESSLIDYFNLCGEEHLYYELGYIDPVVWKSWCNGMKSIIESPRVKPLWEAEKATSSYYGISL